MMLSDKFVGKDKTFNVSDLFKTALKYNRLEDAFKIAGIYENNKLLDLLKKDEFLERKASEDKNKSKFSKYASSLKLMSIQTDLSLDLMDFDAFYSLLSSDDVRKDYEQAEEKYKVINNPEILMAHAKVNLSEGNLGAALRAYELAGKDILEDKSVFKILDDALVNKGDAAGAEKARIIAIKTL